MMSNDSVTNNSCNKDWKANDKPVMPEGVLLQHDPEVAQWWYHTTDWVPKAMMK